MDEIIDLRAMEIIGAGRDPERLKLHLVFMLTQLRVSIEKSVTITTEQSITIKI